MSAYQVPNIEKHPDLLQQFLSEINRPSCKTCDKPAIIKKYSDLVWRRERVGRRKHP